MPDSTESTTTVLESVPAPARVRYWEFFPPTDGPAGLYWCFAWEALDKHIESGSSLTDDEINLVTECVNLAVDVALKAAGVPNSWLPQYEAATAHLKGA